MMHPAMLISQLASLRLFRFGFPVRLFFGLELCLRLSPAFFSFFTRVYVKNKEYRRRRLAVNLAPSFFFFFYEGLCEEERVPAAAPRGQSRALLPAPMQSYLLFSRGFR